MNPHHKIHFGSVLAALLAAGCASPTPGLDPALSGPELTHGGGDAVVIAVIDDGFNPYHLEWRSRNLPQHADADPWNDLPLARPPHEWLAGFPPSSTFASYSALDLTLPDDDDARVEDLVETDKETWGSVRTSGDDAVHYRFIPGTKIVGYVSFFEDAGVAGNTHGARVSSVAAGSYYGTCAECLLVFIDRDVGEKALQWALAQPWIDVVTNSWGLSDTSLPARPANRHFFYAGESLGPQQEAAERGQTTFFSASNGIVGAMDAPTTTLFSSLMGPDWTITVGGIDPRERATYSGSGKPVDVASLALEYPSAGGTTINGTGFMDGTSAATPIVAGVYARALHYARAALDGPSRVQIEGIVARGEPGPCGEARPDCELADGLLTAGEARLRFLHGAQHTPAGTKLGVVPNSPIPAAPALGEDEFANEGHGSFMGRMDGEDAWRAEFARILDPLLGLAPAPVRPAGELEWMQTDSWCRQHLWGAWTGGYFQGGPAPTPPRGGPAATAYAAACPALFPPTRGPP